MSMRTPSPGVEQLYPVNDEQVGDSRKNSRAVSRLATPQDHIARVT